MYKTQTKNIVLCFQNIRDREDPEITEKRKSPTKDQKTMGLNLSEAKAEV